jgi:hypothetical protein
MRNFSIFYMMSSTNETSFEKLPEIEGSHVQRSAIPLSEMDGIDKNTAETGEGSEAPDGGAAAWLVVLGAWCTSFCSFGWINSKFPETHSNHSNQY